MNSCTFDLFSYYFKLNCRDAGGISSYKLSLKDSYYAFPFFLTYKCYNVRYQCQTMSKRHIMRFMHLEVSPAGCFSRLCMLCFTVTLMRAGLPYMGMSARAHSAVPVPSPALLRHCCTLLSVSALCSRWLQKVF